MWVFYKRLACEIVFFMWVFYYLKRLVSRSFSMIVSVCLRRNHLRPRPVGYPVWGCYRMVSEPPFIENELEAQL